MISGAENSTLYGEWSQAIADPDVRDAFRYLVGLCAEQVRFTCHPQWKGDVRDFRFIDDGNEQPFSFIVNRSWLLFYLRPPAIRRKLVSRASLAANFDSLNENKAGEFTVKIRSIADAQRLWRLIGQNQSEFQSGHTETTAIGYINPNGQKCFGHRGIAGSDHNQMAYRMECQVTGCATTYGANGSDIFQRKCPVCQAGAPGIEF